KDADRAAKLGLSATTTAQGAGSFKKSAEAMRTIAKGRRVYIVKDADIAGDGYAAEALATLGPVAAHARILGLPRLPHTPTHGADFTDWLDTYRGSLDELRSLAAETSESESDSQDDDTPITLNTSRVADWPDPMGEAAYIGPVGDFVRKLAQQTE